MTSLFELYNQELIASGAEFNLSEKASMPIAEFCEILHNVLYKNIHMQESSLASFVSDLDSALTNTKYMNKTSSVLYFVNDFKTALIFELTENWITPWTIVKTAANAMVSSGSGIFPASLYFTSPPPSSKAVAGANRSFSTAQSVIDYFQVKKTFYRYDYIQYLAKAISKFINQCYVEFAATTPPPYLPL